jgi:hypothetical protein
VRRPTNDPAIDTFKVEYLVGPSVLCSLIFNYKFSVMEVLWSFSIFLEAVAILPQLFMLQRTGEADTIDTHYLAALGAYRALYIPNWIYRSVSCAAARRDALFMGTTAIGRTVPSTPSRSRPALCRRASTSTFSMCISPGEIHFSVVEARVLTPSCL